MQACAPTRALAAGGAAASARIRARGAGPELLLCLARRQARRPASTGRTPLEQYDVNVGLGKIRSDPYQREMLGSLDTVYRSLQRYQPPDPKTIAPGGGAGGGAGLLGALGGLFGGKPKAAAAAADGWPGPKGIYMFGDVGSGKTMLMDMFYTTVPDHLTKQRIHFHGFMQDVHKRSYKLKQQHGQRYDTADQIAVEVAAQANILCLDEMQVTDVGDAMILRRLLERLYRLGVVTFFTSNRMPIDLYKNGVQRELFVPTIHLLEQRSYVVHLVSPTDYRSLPRPSSGTYFFADADKSAAENAAGAAKHIEHWFEFFAAGEKPAEHRALQIWGRPIDIPRSAGDRVMQFSFMELCGRPLSSADYLEMCRTFEAAIVTDIPELSLEQRDLVRRFITFLDAAYDSHTKLVAAAARPFDRLFNTKHLTIDPKTNTVVAADAGGEGKDGEGNVLDVSNFAGHEEMFAFARALSRLRQMSSGEWLDFER